MKIILRQENYKFLIDALVVVDKRAYDPIYKNIRSRIESTASKDGADMAIFLEESEIFHMLDALNEYTEEAETGKYAPEEKKQRAKEAKDMTAILNKATGIYI